MTRRRVTCLVGPIGSGKSEIAVNLAIARADSGASRIALMDLDLVRPLMRSRDAKRWLESRGVEVLAPSGESAFSDLPTLLPRIRGLLLQQDLEIVADVGGDEVGARVLGSLADTWMAVDPDLFLVVNFRRPFADSVESVVSSARAIECAARIKLTGIVSNTHLKEETTPMIIREGYLLAKRVGEEIRVEVVAVVADEFLRTSLDPGDFSCPIFWLSRYLTLPFEEGLFVRKKGPLFVLR